MPSELARTISLALDPSLIMHEAGLTPDPWQEDFLRCEDPRVLLLCHRQAGKSSATACLALHTALYEPDSLVLLFSPALRQSTELFDKITRTYFDIGQPVAAVHETTSSLLLANGSRIVSLPGTEATVRGFSSPKLVVVDEAARVLDPLFVAIVPMLTVSKGRLVCLSTPWGKRGWFHTAWEDGTTGGVTGGTWRKFKVTAHDNPRIDRAWLEEQRMILGDHHFRQEFMCEFVDTLDQYFSYEAVVGAFDSDVPPLFGDAACA